MYILRALLLGLAFAGNIGGMLTPIASPQNAIALGVFNNYIEGLEEEGLGQQVCVGRCPFFALIFYGKQWPMGNTLVRSLDCALPDEVLIIGYDRARLP